MFPGMGNRLNNDISARYVETILKGDDTRVKKFRINVEAPTHRDNLVFLGGSILSDLMKDRKDFWITKDDYEELGPIRAFSKCRL